MPQNAAQHPHLHPASSRGGVSNRQVNFRKFSIQRFLLLTLVLLIISTCTFGPSTPPAAAQLPTEKLQPKPTSSFSEEPGHADPTASAPAVTAEPASSSQEPDLVSPAAAEESDTIFLPYVSNNRTALGSDWPTVAGNPGRTSWSLEEVAGDLNLEWYRPVEAYISQNTQIIASDGLLFISTARGLYALNAVNGEEVWRFDTELPLGNSPSVDKGVVYVGGYDRKIHALDALTGKHLWAFDGAISGYSTNPLIVEGKVILGNRDGNMYAVGAQGTQNQGQLIWKYQTGGPINFSAAYSGGAVYFASNDNYAYALSVSTGKLIWKSEKLPGDGFNSYWPVIYQDKVIFAAALGYRHDISPGVRSVSNDQGEAYSNYNVMQITDMFFDKQKEDPIGPDVQISEPWTGGKQVIDASRISEYLENNPTPDPHLHKPWRRVFIILNSADGSEQTFDVDSDGHPEYAPVGFWGTRSGNSYPPLVSPDGALYFNNVYSSNGQGHVMSWKFGTPYLSIVGGKSAFDEPQALSAGGKAIYRNLCCDRVGDMFGIDSTVEYETLWHYSSALSVQAPGYDEMWFNIQHPDDLPRLWGNYGTLNGIYHNHGDQNAIIPYGGRLYAHRSNAIVAYGPGQEQGKLPLLKINPVQDTTVKTPSVSELQGRLESELQKIISAGHLRPGYYNTGQFSQLKQLNQYFDNPGDTLLTLALAYPHVSPQMQEQVKNTLRTEFRTYFDPAMYARIGWSGAAREAMPLPPEVANSIQGSGPSNDAGEVFPWAYPPQNFYAMWKYALVFPEDAGRAYDLAKSKLVVPASSEASDAELIETAWEFNAYIAGYIGFLNLQELAGRSSADSQLRDQVSNELNRLLQLRASTFSKDTPWTDDYHKRTLNVARNFMFLVPELGDYLNQYALAKVQEAVNEYNFTAPYWFASRYNAVVNEGVMQPLYDYPAVFQAKAYILKEPLPELVKYLDVPAFERGDLFYIQNLIAAIEAGSR